MIKDSKVRMDIHSMQDLEEFLEPGASKINCTWRRGLWKKLLHQTVGLAWCLRSSRGNLTAYTCRWQAKAQILLFYLLTYTKNQQHNLLQCLFGYVNACLTSMQLGFHPPTWVWTPVQHWWQRRYCWCPSVAGPPALWDVRQGGQSEQPELDTCSCRPDTAADPPCLVRGGAHKAPGQCHCRETHNSM